MHVLHCLSVCVSSINHLWKNKRASLTLWPFRCTTYQPKSSTGWALTYGGTWNIWKTLTSAKWMGGSRCLVFYSHFVIMWHSKTWCHWLQMEPENIFCALMSHSQNNVSKTINQRWMTHSSALLYYSICLLLYDWFLHVRVCGMPDIQFSMCNYQFIFLHPYL